MATYQTEQPPASSPTATFRDDYKRDGFAFPVPVLSTADAASMRYDLERAEEAVGHDIDRLKLLRAYPERLIPSFYEVLFHPAIRDAGQAVLGPDLLVWGSNTFIKEPHTDKIVSWHQDLTYWGLDNNEEVTCWLALSDATTTSGCMQFVAGSHNEIIQPHHDSFADNNLLSRGQELAVDVDPADATDIELRAGEASFHHGHLYHASGPNSSDDRRIGVAIRLITPVMKQRGAEKLTVTKISGTDSFGHFTHGQPPRGFLDDDDFAEALADRELRNSIMFAGAKQ